MNRQHNNYEYFAGRYIELHVYEYFAGRCIELLKDKELKLHTFMRKIQFPVLPCYMTDALNIQIIIFVTIGIKGKLQHRSCDY